MKHKRSRTSSCYDKSTYLLLSYIIPDSISDSKIKSFESHLLVLLRSYKPFLDSLGLYIYTNTCQAVEKNLAIAGIPRDNTFIDAITIDDLVCCRGHSGEHFQYAFSKLDALNAVYNRLGLFKNLQSIIISDIDTIIFDGNMLVRESQALTKICAINYRSEQYTTPKFDQLIFEFCRYLNFDLQEFSPFTASWINSGFVIIPAKFLQLVSACIPHGIEYMKNNKEAIKASCSNHYGDEIFVSAIFNSLPSQTIPLNSNPTAQLVWTCCTATPTFHWVSLWKPPAHIHLPAAKLSSYQLPILNCLSFKSFATKYRIVLMINLWSIESHFIDKIQNILLHKLLKKLITPFGYLVCL